MLSRLIPAPYRPVLANRVFRRLIAGFGVSNLGDGMSVVAVAWLANILAPHHGAGLWVGGAVAAYTLPGVVGALAFGRLLRRMPAKRLMLADNLLRAVFLGAVPLAWLAGLLSLPLYIALLAVSSLLHAWGNAGTYTLLAELVPSRQRLAANTLLGSLNFASTIVGPVVAGVAVTYVSAAVVLGLDALTYLFLAVVIARLRLPASRHVTLIDQTAARGGFALLRARPALLGLLALTWFFYLLYGPVEVALPLHVSQDLHAPGTLLGLYWTLYGIGALVGGLAVGALRRLPLWPTTIAIIIGWGAALLPFGFGAPTAATIAGLTIGGVIYGPFGALSVTLMQETAPPRHLASMLAARSAVLLTASPIGTALGGPLTAAIGPRLTLGASGLGTVALGVVACVALLARRRATGRIGSTPVGAVQSRPGSRSRSTASRRRRAGRRS
ncbi:MAG TPA: MFS transporter [Stackebrandtia sp.]|jgi:MFS family permease|uniref:MFS transporter n=1 Tax=Stackebrandtia sp. TaxID=2023065 RepID=UPI002D38458E|nr:MFS transporter [Stackebrandtia sp.]HZE38912.1 MFS transporter [Stackebrandtia sp.]